ncbi:methyl-CpG-binding domain protein 5-like [Corythoichthys intestinalis]|uniref:methyl-CpG-binding domain protein 5-like n=1 Tax=Corythoichthys intestinalis TaxID=161448 RepID=UPI0025A5A9FC|nr:methyl-CpG-binding domain protein 5-like [Corythoichthys intestinalis]XP_057685900.1 methyl-CpG-binding domain protein 5-like [Corythoichthys intestinalis]XP_057685902.1 methyl-CpG-binding domain protein 5-like [Corythoichthys intestinalis]XP_057685903.1 methyl-CpG-binding domain protein 5-like [Corythoichthys intestinalis]XP_061803363.1 methyl-CpG-binding domain protein 5-like [Nerophis lumbriciformis]
MNGGKDCEAGDERQAVPVQVPIGWQRKREHGAVQYVSPSGSVLSSMDQVKNYLLTDGTCKCGLECPLILHKVFNFDPGAVVKQRTAEDVKSDEDVTKLCIHKRKLLAVATLHKSMESHPPLTLSSPVGGTSSVVVSHSATHRAIRTKPHDVLLNAASPDKMGMTAGHQQQIYPPQEIGGGQQPELCAGYSRPQRLQSCDPGPKSPYRVGYGGMLSPPISNSKLCADGSQSPCTDTLSSPEGFQRTNSCAFPGAGSPSTPSIHGNSRTPLSPPSIMLHGSPVSQAVCAMTGRTSTPLSPTATAKSPVMNNMPRGNFPYGMDMPTAAFYHKPQAPVHPVPPQPPSVPPCVLQKRQLTSEKDPLGILDPIPSKPMSQSPANAPNFQPNIHTQVSMMNVNIPPPAIVPLPSNLPLPTVKPGPVGHAGQVQRTQQSGPASSMSPSPVTSPVHMVGRVEASPHRSRSSSTSSDHGNFAMPSGHQATCSTMKIPPRSPRSAMGSPRPAMPSSPSTNKNDIIHQYRDPQLLSSIGTLQHNNSMYSPTSSSSSSLPTPSASHKGQAGLLRMPINQILNQQNAASFPASSLLSAAAKAQLAHQNKHSTTGVAAAGIAGAGGNGGGGAHSGSISSHPDMEGHSTLNPMLPPNFNMLLNCPEGQSGRAALRDKLMAQQRDPIRKRKQSAGGTPVNHDGSNNNNNMVYHVINKPSMGGQQMLAPGAEQMRKVSRLGNLPPNTSMAQLLQSMSNQSSHNIGANSHHPGLSPGPPLHFSDSTSKVPGGSQQNLISQQRLRVDGLQNCQNIDSAGGHLGTRAGQFPDFMGQIKPPTLNNCGPMVNTNTSRTGLVGPDGMPIGRPHTNPPPLSHSGPHPSQHNLHQNVGQTDMVVMPGGDGSCTKNICDTGNLASHGLQPHVNTGRGRMYKHQVMQQSGVSQPAYPGQQHFSDNPPYTDSSNTNGDSMVCLYPNYQQGMMLHPQFTEGQPHQGEGFRAGTPGSDRAPGRGSETVDAIYRAVVDAASKGMQVTITTTVSGTTQASPMPALSAMSAFTASIGEPANLPQVVSAVLHGDGEVLAQQARTRQVRQTGGQKNVDSGKNMTDGSEVDDYFRSPGRGTPRAQWDGEIHSGGFDTHGNSGVWCGEEFLECSTKVRSSPCMERPAPLHPAPPCSTNGSIDHNVVPGHGKTFLDDGYRVNNCSRTPANYKERLEQTAERCAHINGTTPLFNTRTYGEVLGPPRQELTADDQSPSSSTSLEGPLASSKDYSHYNGHFNGMAPSPSDTKSLSSEEDLRQPDSPSSELLHYRSRTFNMGELVWGQLKGFPPWPAKLAGDEHVHSAAMQLRDQAKVEPEKLKTLTHDLEALDRAAKRGLKPGKLNNHLEAAIHEAMSELDKMSGTIPSRDRQVKMPKPKRRKISR